jgi:hypothetical protein
MFRTGRFLALRSSDFARGQDCQPISAESYVGQAVLVLEFGQPE